MKCREGEGEEGWGRSKRERELGKELVVRDKGNWKSLGMGWWKGAGMDRREGV